MEWFLTTWIAAYAVALATVPSVLMNRRGHPVAAVSWLLALFALPPLALAAWWLLGRTHLRRRRRRRQQASAAIADALSQVHRPAGGRPSSANTGRWLRRLPEALRGSVFPPSAGNAVRLLADTRQVHDYWTELIGGARDHVHVLFFAWHDDGTGRRFRDLLADRAARGCEVRVLHDAVGCQELPSGFFRPIREAGGQVAEFMPRRLLTASPMLNFRNHRKLLIADGSAAYTGGINVTDEYLDWQDLGLAIRGPGVQQLQEVFIDDWYFMTGEELADARYFPEPPPTPASAAGDDAAEAVCETVASGPDQRFNAMREMVFLAITECRERLWIATPYFVPDDAILLALRSAVYRGVDVRLFVPANSDSPLVRRASRAYYPDLLDAEIAIFEYAGMLHAKAFLFDRDRALIGSANLDTRSFRLNFESGIFVTSRRLNTELADFFEAIDERSQRVTSGDVDGHSYLEHLKDAAAHLLSPLL